MAAHMDWRIPMDVVQEIHSSLLWRSGLQWDSISQRPLCPIPLATIPHFTKHELEMVASQHPNPGFYPCCIPFRYISHSMLFLVWSHFDPRDGKTFRPLRCFGRHTSHMAQPMWSMVRDYKNYSPNIWTARGPLSLAALSPKISRWQKQDNPILSS